MGFSGYYSFDSGDTLVSIYFIKNTPQSKQFRCNGKLDGDQRRNSDIGTTQLDDVSRSLLISSSRCQPYTQNIVDTFLFTKL